MTNPAPPSRAPLALSALLATCFFLSGAAGLVYEVVWTRMLILVFGSTSFAISTVLTAFMTGLGLGAFLAGRFAGKIRRAGLAYGVLEAGIGLYALAVPALFQALEPAWRAASETLNPSFYAFSLVRFLLAGSVLLVPTALMGATLPLLSEFFARGAERRGTRIGLLYALNTAGAVAGASLSGFVLLPAFGQSATIWAAAAANLLLGALVLGASLAVRGRTAGPGEGTEGEPDASKTPAADPARPAPAALAPPPGPAELAPAADAAAPPAPPGPPAVAEPETRDSKPETVPGSRLVLPLILASGFVSMTYEVAWSRVLHLLIGSSVYAFTVILASFLTGLASGAAVASAWLRRAGPGRGLAAFGWIQAAASAAVFLTLLYFGEIPFLYARLVHVPWLRPGGELSYGALTGVQFLVAFLVLLVPACLLGAAFPLAVQIRSGAEAGAGRLSGAVYAWNTAGAILGSFAGGFVLLPLLGIRTTLLAGIAGNVALGVLALARSAAGAPPGRRAVPALGAAAAAAFGVAAVLAAPAWNPLLMARGLYMYALDTKLQGGSPRAVRARFLRHREVLFYREGLTTTVMVVDEGEGNRFLSTNGKVDASSKMDMPTQVLLGQIPAAVAPNAEEVLVIGFASGTTVGSILLHPESRVRRVTAVEIEPAVIEASRFFEDVNHRPLDDPRLEVVVEDARNHLSVTRRSFDLIVSEPSNPWMTVASNLFTREFYATARARLKPGGCFCQWLQIYSLRPEDVKSVAATFLSVFPCTYAFFSEEGVDLMLVGSADPFRMDAEALRRRTGSPRVAEDLDGVGVDGVESLLSRFLGGPEELAAFAAGAGLNTDDNARIEFSSPRTLTVNLGSRIQADLLGHFRGISPYIDSIGATAAERADFVAEVAYASWHDEGLDRITRGLARDALSLAPPDGDAAERARTLLGQIEEE